VIVLSAAVPWSVAVFLSTAVVLSRLLQFVPMHALSVVVADNRGTSVVVVCCDVPQSLPLSEQAVPVIVLFESGREKLLDERAKVLAELCWLLTVRVLKVVTTSVIV
jgi:hypothetical protein